MKPSQTCVLTTKGGSSSIKLALYRTDELLQRFTQVFLDDREQGLLRFGPYN